MKRESSLKFRKVEIRACIYIYVCIYTCGQMSRLRSVYIFYTVRRSKERKLSSPKFLSTCIYVYVLSQSFFLFDGLFAQNFLVIVIKIFFQRFSIIEIFSKKIFKEKTLVRFNIYPRNIICNLNCLNFNNKNLDKLICTGRFYDDER